MEARARSRWLLLLQRCARSAPVRAAPASARAHRGHVVAPFFTARRWRSSRPDRLLLCPAMDGWPALDPAAVKIEKALKLFLVPVWWWPKKDPAYLCHECGLLTTGSLGTEPSPSLLPRVELWCWELRLPQSS